MKKWVELLPVFVPFFTLETNNPPNQPSEYGIRYLERLMKRSVFIHYDFHQLFIHYEHQRSRPHPHERSVPCNVRTTLSKIH
ncbi:hypothetical protein CDL12_30563 [Handroanthus impetiginosus]|uniref:Uncharacterized protein n=1 Tax=Handroanthus impetiginosus TaxID=429701 RepID=A0A2G9FV21_9LAMI|nr:hypothetical protein CDL12_30563 [Handroanthus impetiginosus]